MTYTELEQSTQDGVPVFMVKFFRQSGETWYYTNNVLDITYPDGSVLGESGSITFEALPIRVGSVQSGSEITSANLDFTVPFDDPLAQRLLDPFVRSRTFVVVWRAHMSNLDDPAVYWRGRVMASVMGGDYTVRVSCENLMSTMRRAGLRAKYQRTCRHILYSSNCGVSYASRRIAHTISNVVSSIQVDIPHGGGNEFFRNGIIEVDGVFGFITGVNGNRFTLHTPMNNLSAGKSVFLAPGCDLTIGTCRDRFSNLNNHGGFPFIPDRSPYNGSSIA